MNEQQPSERKVFFLVGAFMLCTFAAGVLLAVPLIYPTNISISISGVGLPVLALLIVKLKGLVEACAPHFTAPSEEELRETKRAMFRWAAILLSVSLAIMCLLLYLHNVLKP